MAALCALFVVSYVDRNILALIAAPVSHDLRLSDVQLGLLLGLGFAAVFSVAGIPLAYLLDRSNRIRVIAACVLIWSASTITSAFADGFAWMLACRSGIALGEAVLFPAVVSLVADLFRPKDRALPLTIVSITATLMGGGAFLLGAAALNAGERLQAAGLILATWRAALLIVGLPGTVIAAILLIVGTDPRAPARTATAAATATPTSTSFAAFLRRRWRFYVPFVVGIGLMGALANATVSWVPTLLARAYRMEISRAGYLFGIASLVPGAIGAAGWSALSLRLGRAGRTDAPITGMVMGAALMTVGAALLLLGANSLDILITFVVLTIFCSATLIVLPAFIIHAVAEPSVHARLTALNLLVLNTLGLIGGPLAVPMLAKLWPTDPYAIGRGLAWLGAVTGPLSFLCMIIARRAYGEGRGPMSNAAAADATPKPT